MPPPSCSLAYPALPNDADPVRSPRLRTLSARLSLGYYAQRHSYSYNSDRRHT